MPLGAVYEVSKQWTLGPELCDMWTSSDVLCCTASILHLVAIALDRHERLSEVLLDASPENITLLFLMHRINDFMIFNLQTSFSQIIFYAFLNFPAGDHKSFAVGFQDKHSRQ
ncbi:hypothetical protein RUM43_013618, partial [Polyplax serrata]